MDHRQGGSSILSPNRHALHPLPRRLGPDGSGRISARFAFWLAEVLQPKRVVALGLEEGVAFAALCQAAARFGHDLQAVGLVAQDDARGRELQAHIDRHYAHFAQVRVGEPVASLLPASGDIDLLMMEGGGTDDARNAALRVLRPRLAPGAVLVVPGINASKDGSDFFRILHAQHAGLVLTAEEGVGLVAFPGPAPAALSPVLARAGESPSDLVALRTLTEGLVRPDGASPAGTGVPAMAGLEDGAPQPEALARLSSELTVLRRQSIEKIERLSEEAESAGRLYVIEKARRRHLAEIYATQLVCARRGLRGFLGALIRRFGSGRLIEQCALLTQSGLFDRQYYIFNYHHQMLRNVEPVVEYVLQGAYEGRNPNPLFDSEYYLRTCKDIRRTGDNPLVHYILMGEAEGLRPSPAFDPVEYRSAHPELPSGTLALADYLRETQADGEAGQGSLFTRTWKNWVSASVRKEARRLTFTKGGATSGEKFRSKIKFVPETGKAGPADMAGRYEWTAQTEYTYIPPAPPADLADRLAAMARRPLFSIVVPLYNTPADLLARLVACVEAQWYPDWELILVDDKSPDAALRPQVEALQDPRIVKLFLPDNRGISGATNAGIAAAKGEFIVFLDHDDELTCDCLYELAACVNRDDPDFIYSDEDKLTPDGRFAEPFFKPDWSPDTLMSLMYTCHVSCIRRSLVDEVGGLRPEFDGSQDWDLVLRVTERTRRIAHIAKVLYHWRIIPGSTSGTFDAKPKALIAGRQARIEAARRRGAEAEIEDIGPNSPYARLRYAVKGAPSVTIVIPSKNNAPVLRKCLDSLLEKTSYPHFRVVVVDNGSSEAATLDYLSGLADHPRVRVVRHDVPFNFSQLCNVGAAADDGALLLFLNDDTEIITPSWLDRMIGFAQQPHVGAVGAKLLYPQSLRVQHVGVVNIAPGPSHAFLGVPREEAGYFARAMLDHNWLAVTGACLMVERAKFDAVGRFDETFPIAYNDVDLCYRLFKAGYFNVTCVAAELIHHESLSRGIDHISPEKRARLLADKKRLDTAHPQFYLTDPFFNENLHPSDVNFRPQL